MPRDIPLSNGSLYIAYGSHGYIRELCYPYVGLENHTSGHAQRIGVWIDGAFSWLDDPRWTVQMGYSDGTLKAFIIYSSHEFSLTIRFDDTVDFHENILVRRITVSNTGEAHSNIKLFFHHDFNIYGTEVGDTACYKPDVEGMLHYKRQRYFLINALDDSGNGFAQYATGKKDSARNTGTWMDAEDGELSGNPIAQGAVDSVVGLEYSIKPVGRQAGGTG